MNIRRIIALIVICVAAIPTTAGAKPVVRLPQPSAATMAESLHAKAEAAARSFEGGLGSRIRNAAGLPNEGPASLQGTGAFVAALAALHEAAGLPVAIPVTLPPAPVAGAAAPVIFAAARAATMVNAAFAKLSAAERRLVLDNIDAPLAHVGSKLARRVQDLSNKVDMTLMTQAAALYADALDAFPKDLNVQMSASWVDLTGMIEIGSTGNDPYNFERVLIIDLGGSDTYSAHPGSVGPGWPHPLPVSAVLDLGGSDFYSAQTLDPTPTANNVHGIGVGLGGVGLIVDRWGNDTYYAASPFPSSLPCRSDSPASQVYAQNLISQGVGSLGVGAILDLSGSDTYYAIDQQYFGVPCHWSKIYAYAQGAGLNRGIGLLGDDTGDDLYYAYTYTSGVPGFSNHQDKLAQTYAQGFGAGGAGFLVDKEGNDYYYAGAYAQFGNSVPTKGSFSFVYAQGAVFGLTESYPDTLQGTLIPSLFGGPSVSIPGYCLGQAVAGQGAGKVCNGAGVGFLADILGTDYFEANAYANESPTACTWAAHAVTSAQGAAGWGGLAVLANLDIEGTDQFRLTPYATGGPCGVLGVFANAYGQGFGGPEQASFWDNVYSLTKPFATGAPLPASTIYAPAIGVLASGGAPCRDTQLNLANPQVGCVLGTGVLVASPDKYESVPVASSQTGKSIAESWVQGSSGPVTYSSLPISIPGIPVSATGIGVGVNSDAAGNDTYLSKPSATGNASSSALSMAQASTRGGIAALVNVGGDDSYESRAIRNSISQPGSSFGQGYAQVWTAMLTQPIAAFAEVAGNDTYAYPPPGCPANENRWGGTIWGGCGQPGTIIVGIDTASGLLL